MNLSKTQLLNHLEQFYGTQYYYPLWPKVLLTDGSKYLAETAGCYWLMDAITQHIQYISSEDFISCRLITRNNQAQLILDDGNGNVLAKQRIHHTDFPLDDYQLYACRSADKWVILLPSEY